MNEFNAEEVLEIACQIERNGVRFYRRAAELVSSPEARKMLGILASMEVEHEKFFNGLRGDNDLLDSLSLETEGEAVKYLKAIAVGKVFPPDADPSSELADDVTLTQVLRKAIEMEMASIAFYQGIREVLPAGVGGGKVEHIIREEMRHVTMLTEKLFVEETAAR